MFDCEKEKAAGADTLGGARREAHGKRRSHSHSTPVGGQRQVPRHGTVRGQVWSKRVHKRSHFLWQYQAWSVDASDLLAAEQLGVKRLCWREQDYGHSYETTPEMFRRRGISIDRGHGAQIALPEPFWSIDGRPPEMTRPSSGTSAGPLARQLSLFDGVPR